MSSLKEYEKFRDQYPTLESFMLNIINALKKVKQDSIDKWLNMVQKIREPDISDIPSNNEIYNRNDRLLILSTTEQDTAADIRLKKFVTQSHRNYRIVDDTTALNMDLSTYNLFVIGTPWGNKFLEKYIPLLPLKITPDRLIAGKVYDGNGYAFLSGWINPFNPLKIMVIYAAQNPDDLVNFTWVPRGDTDYLIIKHLITLKASDYRRHNKIWGYY
jgi:hypothetical protein